MAHPDTLYVLAAAYDDVPAAVEDYEAVKALYYAVKTSHDFDAAVIAKDEAGKVSIVKKHEQPTRHGAAVGLGWGLAAGVAAALFPPVGILGALAVGRRRRRRDRGRHRARQRRDEPRRPQGTGGDAGRPAPPGCWSCTRPTWPSRCGPPSGRRAR